MSGKLVIQHVTPLDGGALVDVYTPEMVGHVNYTEKTNWRRLDDREIVREGRVVFAPHATQTPSVQAAIPQPCMGLWEAVRPNGDRCLVSCTHTTIHKFDHSTGLWTQIGSGFTNSNRRWQGCSSDGNLFLNNPGTGDLPVSYRLEDSSVTQLKELRDVGVASVGTICTSNGFLLLGDITEIIDTELVAWMNGGTPYGIVPANKTNRVRYKIVCSDYLKPTNFAPLISGTIQSATKTKVTLDYVSSAFQVGTKVAVIGAGVDGGVLGGGVGFEDGVPITAISGNEITLGLAADNTLTYPVKVGVTRWTDTSTFSSSFSIQDDGSAILRIMTLKRQLLVIRETGIFSGRYTGVVETPFVFTPEYQGVNVPAYPEAAIEVAGDAIVYPTKTNFYYFDGSGAPLPFKVLDLARRRFFQYAAPSPSSVYASNNEITKEVWFHTANGILAFDHVTKTASWIDEAYSGAVSMRIPSTGELWFVIVRPDGACRYGATETGIITRLRNGTPTVATLTGGFFALSDGLSQKQLRGFMPLVASGSQDAQLRVTMYGTESGALPKDTLFTEVLASITIAPMIETHYRNTYIQDQVQYVDTTDKSCELFGRAFRVWVADTRGVTRTE